MFSPHFEVLCDLLLTDTWQHAIYLFYIIKNLLQLFYFKIFHSYSKAAFAHFGKHTKKARLVQKNHATVKLDLNGFSWNENLLLRLLEYFCQDISYFFLLLVSVQCLDNTILYLIFSQSHNILSLFSKLSAILKYRRKNLCNDGINHASVL